MLGLEGASPIQHRIVDQRNEGTPAPSLPCFGEYIHALRII